MKRKKVLLLLLLTLTVLFPTITAAQEESVEYLRYDVEITVNEDGSFAVREIQTLLFNGAFSQGFAEIPLAFSERINILGVSGGISELLAVPYESSLINGENRYSTYTEGDNLIVEWGFEETEIGSERTFILEYNVIGGLWVYPEMHTLEWRAIAENRGLPVSASTVTVTLPFGEESLYEYIALGANYDAEVLAKDGGDVQIVYELREPLPDGTPFQLIVDFAPDVVDAQLQQWQIDAETAVLDFTIEQIDVEMVIEENGRLLINETQRVRVNEGVMYTGNRALNLLFLDNVELLSLTEGEENFTRSANILECEFCYAETQEEKSASWARFYETSEAVWINDELAGSIVWEWRFPPLVAGEVTEFTLAYAVDGAVRLNEDNQTVSWQVAPAFDAPIEDVALTVTLPSGVAPDAVTVDGGTMTRLNESQITVQTSDPTEWRVELVLPPDATTASIPEWQTELEAAFAAQDAYEIAQARRQVATRTAGGAGVVTAVLGALASWYLWGSRRMRETLGNYRTTPPSDLPPGIVSYLVSGKQTVEGVLATLLHMGSLGLVRFNFGEQMSIERTHEERVHLAQKVQTASGETVQLTPHIVRLFNEMREQLPLNQSIPLQSIMPRFMALMPHVTATMVEEMVNKFYAQTQGNGRIAEQVKQLLPFIWFGAVALTMFSQVRSFSRAPFGQTPEPNIALIVGVMFGGLILMNIINRVWGNSSSSITQLGNDEAKKWRGFKSYLQNIQQYADLEEAQEILNNYFAYAVALGAENELVQQAQQMGLHVPRWVGQWQTDSGETQTQQQNPFPQQWQEHQRRRRWRRRINRGGWLPTSPRQKSRPVTTSAPKPSFSLERMAGNMTQSLENASGSLTQMLNTAVGDSSKPTTVDLSIGGRRVKKEWDADTPLDTIVTDIFAESKKVRPPRISSSGGSGGSGSSGGGRSSGGYGGRSSSFGRSSRSSSRSRSRSRSSTRSRSSRGGSRRSGGGGRRGFK